MVEPHAGSALLYGWTFKIPLLCHLLYCGLIAIAVRLIQSILRAWSIRRGDHGFALQRDSLGKNFVTCFGGFSNDLLDDLWMPTLIGFAEVVFYPVLIATNNLEVIGAWLIIKTAGTFRLWTISRRAYNRFLVLNIINLAIAYFMARWWISTTLTCPPYIVPVLELVY